MVLRALLSVLKGNISIEERRAIKTLRTAQKEYFKIHSGEKIVGSHIYI